MSKWPEEIIEWLRKNTPGKTTKDLTVLINRQGFNEKYGMVFTESMIKGAKSRYAIQSGTKGGNPRGYSPKYPKGLEDYIRSIAEGKTVAEIAKEVSNHFGIEFSEKQCRDYKKNHDIVSGVDSRFKKGNESPNKGRKMSREQYERCKGTMFKKGVVPANHLSIGQYTHTTDGYLIQKVREEGNQQERFEYVHRAVWEKQNGPVPEGKMIIFLDGNKDNCSIENLVLIDRRENLELNRSNLRFDNAEFTKVGVTIAKMKVATRRRKK